MDPTAVELAEMMALTGSHSSQTLRVNEAAALPSPAVMLSARIDR